MDKLPKIRSLFTITKILLCAFAYIAGVNLMWLQITEANSTHTHTHKQTNAHTVLTKHTNETVLIVKKQMKFLVKMSAGCHVWGTRHDMTLNDNSQTAIRFQNYTKKNCSRNVSETTSCNTSTCFIKHKATQSPTEF